MSEIEVFASRQALCEAVASALINAITEAIAAKGAASLALAGGSTPAPVYRLLAQADLEWAKLAITLTDERCVAVDHPDSNEAMLRATLLQGPAAAARFSPVTAAAVGELAPFDAVLLGMGEDGHFASLFPGNAALPDGLNGDSLVVEIPAGEPTPREARVSLTLKAFEGAGVVLLLVAGAAKRAVLDHPAGRPVAALIDKVKPRILWAD